MLAKPDRIFARDFEWRHLARFADRAGERPQLGVISGRHRQGKTFLVEALAALTGGFYFAATEATEVESLMLFSAALAEYTGTEVPHRFASWDEAVRQLFALSAERREIMVIDEFPYLCKVSPALPSIIQREIDRAVSSNTPVSLLLCGSAMSVMGRLPAGNAPLRGRASMELVVRPFEYRLAADYWRVSDPRLAVQTHAVVGGTPAYLRFLGGDGPQGPEDFDDWVRRTVLDPGTPLFREARYLLEEEADVRDSALYHSVLAAVATGNSTRGGIASYIGRKATDIGHHLNVLEDSCLLRREPDVFHPSRSVYRVCEPLINFYQVVMRPRWGLLESGRAAAVWKDARARFSGQVLGPHFEEICRAFARTEDVFGELPGEVGAGVITDPVRREQIEVDVAVFAPAMPGEPRRVLSLGEVKWGKAMGPGHSARLRRARELLAAKKYDVRDTVLACYSGVGFDGELGSEGDVRAVGLGELYG
ncbi:ATP-binding protein [Nonomuraea glycinis]|uniref:ATPase AAA n=1 Tax=Nonomuraea glycinis TaxID=2047744 RepID=A0A917ZYT7_9ACTN|nr:ATP-binding protein [Nonomuraea glycinis]MCA2175170.1 ATP-binding protein [Nonomuraea glycinis]GGP00678.1 ATPase AAA [Nonomuraea glycinis]